MVTLTNTLIYANADCENILLGSNEWYVKSVCPHVLSFNYSIDASHINNLNNFICDLQVSTSPLFTSDKTTYVFVNIEDNSPYLSGTYALVVSGTCWDLPEFESTYINEDTLYFRLVANYTANAYEDSIVEYSDTITLKALPTVQYCTEGKWRDCIMQACIDGKWQVASATKF